jgi:hypothetical protein
MPNPVLNDKSFNEAARVGWAAPDQATQYVPGISDGPISNQNVMTMGGTMTATGVLFALLLAGSPLCSAHSPLRSCFVSSPSSPG